LYKEAIEKALKLCQKNDLDTGPFVFGKQTAYSDKSLSLLPVEMIANNNWDIENDGFTNHALLIDKNILHSVVSGFLNEAHVPMVENMRRSIRHVLPSNESFQYIVVDVSKFKKGNRNARQLYMKSLKEWHKQFPFRMYIIYGANAFMTVAFRLARPFMPFKGVAARNIEHAFKIIREDKYPTSKEKKDIYPDKTDPENNFIEDLLGYIGGINWEKEGRDRSAPKVNDQNHPFAIVFQAIELIKDELDDLFKEREKFQTNLIESEKKYREMFEKGSDLLCLHDLEGNLIESNIAFKKEYGLEEMETVGVSIRDFITERYRKEFDDYLHRIKTRGHDTGVMNVTIGKGQEILLEYNNTLARDKNGKPIGIRGSARNITDRVAAQRESKRLEGQLIQKHKMEAIGILSGGIAHDFNNILSIIIGNAELALGDLTEQHPSHSNLDKIIQAVLKGKDIVTQLLNFSRNTEPELRPIKIGPVIEDSTRFFQSIIPTTIDIRTNIQATTETILADPTQINQVMINLCTNSWQEMEESGGMLSVDIKRVVLDSDSEDIHSGLANGNYTLIKVRDTGRGIDSDIIDQIFDPYFTTKEFGNGSGMGLSVVHGIVQNHNGTISVSSHSGKGTTFTICFPLIEVEDEMRSQTPIEENIPHGNETILFIDDDESIVTITKQMIERLGYRVEASMSPLDALQLFQLKPNYFDLVITDMTMPQMTGDKLFEKMRAIRPDIPVIIFTGHSPLIDKEKAKKIGATSYVMKPVVMNELAHAIRNALNRAN
jgi:PAS domain S-box-containing protein